MGPSERFLANGVVCCSRFGADNGVLVFWYDVMIDVVQRMGLRFTCTSYGPNFKGRS